MSRPEQNSGRPEFSHFGVRLGRTVAEAGLLVILPLLFSRSFAEQFSYPKRVLTEGLVILAAVAWALGAIWHKSPRQRRSHLRWPVLALAISVLISCVNSPVLLFSLSESVYFLCGLAWVVVLTERSTTTGEKDVHRLYALSAVGGAAVAFIAVLQWAGHDPLLFGGYRINWGSMVARMRLYSTFGNPNFVAGYQIATVFAAAALAAVSARRAARAAWSVAAAMMLAALVGTGSRGAWVGLAAGLVAAALVLMHRRGPLAALNSSGSAPRSFAKVHSLVLPACLALFLSVLGDLVNAGLRHLEGRVFLWRAAWPMFRDHPILGGGWATFQLRFLGLQASYLAAHPAMARHWSNIRQLHNDLFQLLLETGLLGLLAFAGILWVYAGEVHNSGGSGRSPRLLCAASAAGTTALLVDSFFNFQFATPPTLILLFTLLAIPEILASHEPPPGASLASNRPDRPSRRGALVLRVGASVGVGVGATLLLAQTARQAVAERDYARASSLESRGDLAGAEKVYRLGIRCDPLNGRLHFGLARVLYLANRYPEALAEIPLAQRTFADSHLEVLKARTQDELGLGPAALETYRHALALDPTLKTVQVDIERLSGTR